MPAESLDQALSSRESALKSFRALGSVSYTGRGEKGSFQSAIVVERPNKIRVEALSPFGAVWILTYDGKELVRLDTRAGVRQRGEGTEERMRAHLKLPMTVNDLIHILMGLPPQRDFSGPYRDPVYDPALGATRIARPFSQNGEQRIWLSSLEEPPVRIEEEDRSGIFFRADFLHPVNDGGLSFPTEINVFFPRELIRVRILYKTPELNPSLSKAVFEQERDGRVREIPF